MTTMHYANSCSSSCPYSKTDWPRWKPTPLCRLMLEHNQTKNPVTRAVYAEIIAKRQEDGEVIECKALDRKR